MKLKKREDQQIIQFIQELDFAEARGFPLLFAFKKKGLNQIVALEQQKALEYKQDMQDPTQVIKFIDM